MLSMCTYIVKRRDVLNEQNSKLMCETIFCNESTSIAQLSRMSNTENFFCCHLKYTEKRKSNTCQFHNTY